MTSAKNTAVDWRSKSVKVFIDQYGTKFTRGPFECKGHTYEWMLRDAQGTDMCTSEQMIDWNIIMTENLTDDDA